MATRKTPSKRAAAEPSVEGDAPRGYTVLARRYRSRSFDEIIGQEPIARTLRNAIAQGRVAHAYLFCGTRGVGKTSMARIFAAALNVSDQAEAEAIRDAIMRGQDMDVIEIDGASNRGIDDARELIAAAGIAPARSPSKIYIIDEVHMLTTPAFNALLKTMEEPPPNVKFILCTTEAHKVPATIQSRCQRFDFRAIPPSQIGEHLRDIFAREGISAQDEVVRLLARQANGSMRDALSLADRLIAASEGELTRTLAEEVLGLPDEERVSSLVEAIRAGDAALALERSAELLEQGIPVERALELLADRYRTLMLTRVCGAESTLLDLGAEARRAVASQVADTPPELFVHHIALCDAAARHARGASTPRTIFDATIVRLALSDRFTSLREAQRDASGKGPRMDAPRGAPAAGGASVSDAPGRARGSLPAAVAPARPQSAASGEPPRPAPPRSVSAEALTPRQSSTQDHPPRPGASVSQGASPAAEAPRPASPRSATGVGDATRATEAASAASGVRRTPLHGADLVAARNEVVNHPVVQRAMDLFDASIHRIERIERAMPAAPVSDPASEDPEEAHPPS
ncbi:MAG: DNA polymerase III subunit gamma/tau [Phycisphaeraceae bacterium]|nr:DNA polymerase III subunit gamma/tau [Phycisphaeraceae bacterium]